MSTPDPHLSVVIPAYNAAAYLAEAIASVQSQSAERLQIVVVDDGSTDGTRAVVSSIGGIEYRHQPRAGAAAARNAGVRMATGGFLAFLDADDYWAPGKIAEQMAYLSTHATDMVFGHAEEFCSANAPPTLVRRPAAPTRIAGTMLIRRAAFERVGGFDSQWRVGEFVDWYFRAVDAGLTDGMVPSVVLHRRLHAENSGRTLGAGGADYVRLIKRAMDRRRAAAAGTR